MTAPLRLHTSEPNSSAAASLAAALPCEPVCAEVHSTPADAHHAIVERLSHELRTPLNSVIGFSRVLQGNRKGNQAPADLAMLEAIRLNGERLLGLVEDLVALSVTPPVSTDPVTPLVNVVQIAEDVVNKWAEIAGRKGVRVVFAVESYDMMRVDPMNLARLLDKLVGNAVKFTERGRVTVTVARRNGWVNPGSIIVSDTGIGIPADHLAVIFEPFSQVDGSTRRQHEGAGLGLPIAKALAQSMGCSLTVDSKAGVGTQFEVQFPR